MITTANNNNNNNHNVPIMTASAAYPQPTNPHLQVAPTSPNHVAEALNQLGKRLESATKKAGSLAGNLYTHLRTAGPDGALNRLAHGTRVLAEGGCDRLFRQLFPEASPAFEKLLAAYACYLSTTAGPVMGTLYISNRRVAFSSDQPLRVANTAASGEYYYATGVSWCYYKVVVMLEDVEAVNASANRKNPADKYVQVMARDGHEFWFMGFIFYDKALKDLRKAMQHRCCLEPGPPPLIGYSLARSK